MKSKSCKFSISELVVGAMELDLLFTWLSIITRSYLFFILRISSTHACHTKI